MTHMHDLPLHGNLLSRNLRIDFLRGIAIFAVLILHFSLAYGLRDSPLGSILPRWLLTGLVRNGNYGVTIFFVISGFLITSHSLARWGELHQIDVKNFYVMRFARIMPSLLLVLSIIVILGSLNLPFFANTDNKQDLPASYFVVAAGSVLSFWHNVLMQSTGYFNYCLNIYWSLSVEEVFYLAMPLLCISLRKRWMLLIVCLGLIVYGPIYRSQHLGNEIFYMYGYFACFDAIAIGCLTALLSRQVRITQPVAALLRVIAGIALCVVYLRGIAGNEIFGFSLIALSSALFLFGSSAVDASTGKTSKWDISAAKLTSPLRWLGRHSYELYLFHIIVLAAMRNLLDKTELSYWARLPWLMLFLLLSAILAALVARYVSEPANRAIRQRWLRPSAKLAVS